MALLQVGLFCYSPSMPEVNKEASRREANRLAAAAYRERVGRSKINARAAEYRERNRQKTRDSTRAYREAYPERVAATKAAHYAKKRATPEGRLVEAEKWRLYHLRYQFGLTPAQYAEMLGKQRGTCALCPATEGRPGGRMFVDHDHSTGAVRGLLCGACNSGLGFFKDNVSRLRRAIQYLEEHRL